MSRETPDSGIDFSSFGLDALGRVRLSDDLLAVVDEWEGTLSAGGNNEVCPGPGPVNQSCINGQCDDSVNGSCVNLMCEGALNGSYCKEPREVPEG